MLIGRGQRGFTLPEIMLAALLLVIVSGALWQLLLTTQKLSRSQVEHLALQANLRTGALVLGNELRELSTVPGGPAHQNDILAAGSTSISYRAMRGFGVLCQPSSARQLRLAGGTFSRFRDPQPGRDSAYLLLDSSSARSTGTSWLPVSILAAGPASPCPGGGASGLSLTVGHPLLPPSLPAGTPVRIYEIMELKLYRSDGASWLGARSVSSGEAIQPVLGPLSDHNGIGLEYLDGNGTATSDRTGVKSIRMTIRGLVQTKAAPVEHMLVSQVALRNAGWP